MNKYLFTICILFLINSCKQNEFLDNYYQIISVTFKKCINIPESSEQNGEILIVGDKDDSRFNQEWKLEQLGKYYILRSKYNNKVITANENKVVQSEFKNLESQLWIIQKHSAYTNIISVKNKQALTVIKGDWGRKELALSKLENTESQKWILKPSGMQYIKADFNRVLAPEDMIKDLDFFFEKLETVHVNPYAYVGKDSVEQRKKDLKKIFSRPLRYYEFNREFAKLNGLFDGHSQLSLDWSFYKTYCNKYGRLFPYDVKLIEDNLYIKNEVDSLNMLKICSINEISTKRIIKEIKKTISIENEYKRKFYLESNFKELIIAVLEIESPYNLLVKDSKSEKLKSMSFLGLPNFKIPQKSHISHSNYSLREYRQDSIAIIEYNTSAAHNWNKWKNDIDSLFDLVKKHDVKYLFLDVSRNGGGSTRTNFLFFNNINHEPNPFKYQYFRKPSLESRLYMSKLSTAKSSSDYRKLTSEYLTFISSKKFTIKERDSLKQKEGEIKPVFLTWCTDEVKDGFDGELIIIQSNKTYSAACDMAAWFKYGEVGTTIGCETGGRTELFCEAIPFQMPNSKMRFRIADNYWKFPEGNLYKGIIPDIDLGYDFYKDKYELEDLKDYLKLIKESPKD